jgi:hypothetical protein
MSRAHARRVLADVRRGSLLAASGYVDDGDPAAMKRTTEFVDDLESVNGLRVHVGLLTDMDLVVQHLKTVD